MRLGQQIEFNLLKLPAQISTNEEDPIINNAQATYSKKKSKIARNMGDSYINVKGNFVPARKFKSINSNCRRKCQHRISEAAQKDIFDKYWSLGSYNQRILFVNNLINISDTKTISRNKNLNKPRNRQYHIEYFLEYESVKTRVCQKCFRQCLNETESYLKTVVQKKLKHPHVEFVDHRGSRGGANKLSENIISNIKEHINSFPSYESHYSRRDSTCKYFHSSLTLLEMHKLYCERYRSRPISLTSYTKIFKSKNTFILF